MEFNYICNDCGTRYSPNSYVYKCNCGGMLNLEKHNLKFSMKDIITNEWSLFRYLKVLPFKEDSASWREISMGEGLTSIVSLNDHSDILIKMDYMMPTLSFKDRGAAVLIAKAKEAGVTKVIQDSSGNGGNAIAAYAKRAGILCDIYVPEGTSSKKIKMISSHGANVHIIPGTREDTAKAALEAVEKEGIFYASHVYNPYFYEGTKTFVYEIYEQLEGNMVDTLVLPVGNGTLVLGCFYGLMELYEMGLINRLPRIIGVQAEGCAPLYKAFREGKDQVEEVANTGTMAEGIAIAHPKRSRQIIEAIRITNGDIIIAPERKIPETQEMLAKNGFYVEPTTAASFAGFFEYNNSHKLGKVLIPLCGAGLKTVDN